MEALKESVYTVEDIYKLPDGERAELVDGKIYNMAPPGRTHQRILGSIFRKIADYIDSKNGGCKRCSFCCVLNERRQKLCRTGYFCDL